MGFLYFFRTKEKRQSLEKEARRQKVSTRIDRELEHQKALESNNNDSTGKEKAYLVIFSASWCGPSKLFIKEINEAGINNYSYIDVEEESELAEKFKVRAVPLTYLLDEQGYIIETWLGYEDKDPGQKGFVNFIKNSPYDIRPYSEAPKGLYPKGKKQITQDKIKEKKKETKPKKPVYSEKIKEDLRETFYNLEDIKYRSMGSSWMLAPYDGMSFFEFQDASILPMIANTERIKKYLPGLGFTDEKKTKDRLMGFLLSTEQQLGVTYFIRCSNVPSGMIFIHTPKYNKKVINLSIWTIDFFICEELEHKGIMYKALVRTLQEMKNAMGVKDVYATVDVDNKECRNLLGNGLFHEIDNSGFKNNNGGAPQ
jgi:thiol-disulfide isomerase/thioredoxin